MVVEGILQHQAGAGEPRFASALIASAKEGERRTRVCFRLLDVKKESTFDGSPSTWARVMAWPLETEALVNDKRDYYGFEFCPGFWDWLDFAWAAGQSRASKRCTTNSSTTGISSATGHRSPLVLPGTWRYRGEGDGNGERLGSGVGRLHAGGQEEFAAAADSALLAYALAGGHTAVTHELPANTRKRIPIPNAASALDVAYASLADAP